MATIGDGGAARTILEVREDTDRAAGEDDSVAARQVRRERQVALRAEVAAALAAGRDLRAVLQQCAEALVHHLDAAFARVWTVSDDGTVLDLQASAGLYTHTDGPHARVPVGKFKIGLIAEERKPHLTNDVLRDPRVSSPEWAAREGMVAFAGYPLLVEDRLVGVLAMFAARPSPRTPSTGSSRWPT